MIVLVYVKNIQTNTKRELDTCKTNYLKMNNYQLEIACLTQQIKFLESQNSNLNIPPKMSNKDKKCWKKRFRDQKKRVKAQLAELNQLPMDTLTKTGIKLLQTLLSNKNEEYVMGDDQFISSMIHNFPALFLFVQLMHQENVSVVWKEVHMTEERLVRMYLDQVLYIRYQNMCICGAILECNDCFDTKQAKDTNELINRLDWGKHCFNKTYTPPDYSIYDMEYISKKIMNLSLEELLIASNTQNRQLKDGVYDENHFLSSKPAKFGAFLRLLVSEKKPISNPDRLKDFINYVKSIKL